MGTTSGAVTGWHCTAEWRLNGFEADRFAEQLEGTGRVWASGVPLAQGCALVEVRSRQRPYPLIETLRTADECTAALTRLAG